MPGVGSCRGSLCGLPNGGFASIARFRVLILRCFTMPGFVIDLFRGLSGKLTLQELLLWF